MQRQPESSSAIFQLYNFKIADQFLDLSRYRQIQDNCRKGTHLYEILSYEVENYFKLILEVPSKCNDAITSNNHLEKWEIKNFKSFLVNLFDIFNLLSEFHIEGFQSIRSSRIQFDTIQFSFPEFTNKIEAFSRNQDNFRVKSQKYRQLFKELEAKERFLKDQMKKPQYNYNIKFINAELLGFQDKMSQKQTLENQISEAAETIAANSKEFERQLMFLKQKLIKSKYRQLQNINKLCKNSKQSLIQIHAYLFDYVQKSKDLFRINKFQISDNTKFKLMQPQKLSGIIISETSVYNCILEEYINLLNSLIDALTYIANNVPQLKYRQMDLLEQLKKYYQYNQCDITEVKSMLELYNTFLKFLGEVGDKLVFSVNNIRQIQKKINKCAQMTLTLVKCSPQRRSSPKNSKRKSSFSQKTQEQKLESHKYLDILSQELNPVYIQNILYKVYQDIRESLQKIKGAFLVAEPYRRKPIENSMSISYISQATRPQQKKPSRQDVWLWKNWKEVLDKKFIVSDSLEIFLKQLQTFTALQKQEDKEQQTLNTIFQNKKIPGMLKLKQKSLIFEANDCSLTLFIPLSQIQKVDMELKIMNKTLTVDTSTGTLYFLDLTEGGIKQFFVSVQKAIDYNNENGADGAVVSNKIVLSEAQIQFINKRKENIQKDLEPLQGFQNFQNYILKDTDIVDFYKAVYSGAPVVYGGKQYQNFGASISKKYSNYNDVYGEFDKPGPEYYTGIQGVTFENCPVFSEKIIEYDHTLPKIPFFPESCHNKQTVRLYWVSHQQFHVKQTNMTSGVSFAQNFYFIGLNIVKQIDKDIELKFHVKVVQLNDFSMKKMIIGKGFEEFKGGVEIMIQHVKKIMARYRKKDLIYTGLNQGDPQNQSLNSDRTIIKQYKRTIKGLQTRNRQLYYVIGAVFIINMILLYFF